MRSLGLLLVLCLFSCMFTNAERCEANGIGITKSRFDAPVKQYYYASADQQDIYVLTYAGTIYRSTDRGLTFLNKMSSFPQWNNGSMAYPHGRTGVKKIHGTGTDHIVYFEGNYLSYWVTRGDDIYKLYNLGSTDASGAITGSVVQKLSVNPQQPSTLFRIIVSPICFSSNFEECNQMLQVSMYEGADNSWVDVNDYTFKAAWGAQEDQLLYITIEEQYRIPDQTEVTQLDQHKELNVAMDYGQTLLEAVPHVIDFVYKNGVVYFVKYTGDTLIPYSTNDASSANEMTFAGATNLNFTTGMPAFNILTSGEDVSFISVAQGQPFSNLYQSPANDASYWISLEYLRTDGAGVDFYKTNDLPGVYIANRYAADKAFSDERNDYIETVISFDQGGQWVRLDSIDHMDEFVNLFITAEYTGQPIQSSEQAAGILYSLGNEGEYRLDDDMGLYLSRTGGKKWERVLDGNHIFAFNDHASLITATEQRGDTSTLLYSWNQGISWETCSWGDSEPFTVQAIIPLTNYPNGLQFLIFGELHNGEGIGMSVDFMQNIPRICAEPDDYETFEAVVGDTCLLGRSTPYIRRKRDSACVAPGIEQQQGNSFNCACTRYDFQCDGDCFEERHVEGELNTVCVNICEGQENDPTLPPADCQGRYYQTQGYRKVPGDTCIGGTEYLPVLTDCPSEISPSSSNSASPIPSPSSSPLPSASSSPAPSSSSTGTATVTKSPEPSPSASSQPEPSPSASSQPEPSPSASSQPEPSPSASSQPEPSPSSEPEPSPSSQPEPSPSSEPEPSASGSPQPEPSSVGKTESPTPTSSLAKTVMVSKTVAGSPGDSSNVSSEESSNEEETEGLPIPIIVGSSVAVGFVGVVAIACIAAVVIFIKKKKTGKSKAARMEEEDVFSLEDNDEWEL